MEASSTLLLLLLLLLGTPALECLDTNSGRCRVPQPATQQAWTQPAGMRLAGVHVRAVPDPELQRTADGTGNSASGSQALAWVLSLYSCCAAAIAHQSSSLAVGVAGWTAATLVLAMPGWQGRGMPGGTAQREAFFWRRRGCTGSSRQQPEAHACHCCEAHSSTMLLGPSAVAHSGQRLLPLLRVSLVAHGCGAGRVGLRVVCVAQQRLRLACVCARQGVWGAAGLCGL